MRKSLFFVPAALAVVFFFGCSSTKQPLMSYGPVGILSVTGSVNLPYYEDEVETEITGDGLLSKSITSVIYRDNPEITTAQTRLDYCIETMEKLISENAGIEVIGKEQFLASPVYQGFHQSVLSFADPLVYPTNYKKISELGAKNARLLMNDIGANSLLTANFKFYKTLVDGTKYKGKISVRIEADFTLYNSSGKAVLTDSVSCSSFETTDIDMLKYDKNAIVNMIPALTEEAVSKFVVRHL